MIGGGEDNLCLEGMDILFPALSIKEKALPALSLPIKVPLLPESAKPTLRNRKTQKSSHDGLEKGDLHPHIVGVVVPLIIDPILSPLSPTIS